MFTKERRASLLSEYFGLFVRIRQLERELEESTGPEESSLEQIFERTLTRRDAIVEEYEAGLPIIALSRCPICEAVTRHSLDIVGLDGLWWNYTAPVRGVRDAACPHFLVLAGAVGIVPPVEFAPYLVEPGPEVPFVVPRILDSGGVAVVGSVQIGRHTGYPITYFAEQSLPVSLTNTWGTSSYTVRDGDGSTGWAEAYDGEDAYDFDVESWVHRGRLLWIAPGDVDLALRREVPCPYAGLSGARTIRRLQNGRVWSSAAEILRP